MPRSMLEMPDENEPLRPTSIQAHPPPIKYGGLATTALSILLFILMAYALNVHIVAPGTTLLDWATFALHPILMTLAFGLCMPIGAVAWRTFEDAFGMPHGRVKAMHLLLMTAAMVIGIGGPRST